jgi:photosystem II stability/assembly factor-like uncharacterized protein
MSAAILSLFVLLSLVFIISCTPCTDKVYVGTVNGLLAISTDGGEKWASQDSIPEPLHNPYVHTIFAVGENIYMGRRDGLAVSNNGGKVWKRVQLNPDSRGSQDVFSVFAFNDRVYAGADHRFCISNDNGKTWPINRSLPDPDRKGDSRIFAVYADNKRSFIGSGSNWGLGVSEDDGKNWRFVDRFRRGGVPGIAGVGNKVYAGLGRGLAISENGGQTWRVQNISGLGQGGVESVFASQEKIYVTSYDGGVSISKDGGKTWVSKTESDGLASNIAASAVAVGNNVYVGTEKGLSVSRDGGNTWTTKNVGLPNKDITAVFAHCL